MVSRENNLKTLADFKGKEIAMPFRADMPDIIFQALAEKQGLDVKRDFKLRYVASPLDAMQLLITRRVDHALLAEPAVSTALRKTRSFPVSVIAPELYRSVDLTQEWGRLMQREARIPQAGITVLGKAAQDMTAGRSIHTKELVVSLRNYVREALDLEPIPANVIVPAQGPLRPNASGGASKRAAAGNDGGSNAGGAGRGGNGGGQGGGGMGAMGLGMGMGAGVAWGGKALSRSKKRRRRSMGRRIRSCRHRPGRASSCARDQATPTGMKRCSGASTASASALLPRRQSRLSVLRRAPAQLGHSV